jgi:DNA mismatch endonuclease (patch repair protein)
MRFRKDFSLLIGEKRIRPDIVFTRRKLAIFIDGCFWHLCPVHCDVPKSNLDYWIPKLQRNVARDRAQDTLLRDAGWTVLRIWEHTPISVAADLICSHFEGGD